MWAKGNDMPDTLNLRIKPPENVLEDVSLFIEGLATFYELPPKQGRRKRVIRTLADAGGNDFNDSGRTIDVGQLVQRERRIRESGFSGVPSKTVQHGKTRKTSRGGLPREDISKSSGSTARLVASKVTTMEPVKGPEVVIKKSRGRPRRSK